MVTSTPAVMRIDPPLDWYRETSPAEPYTVLFINPFYPKDPVASFGKHVLTPTLALTSLAGATPPQWAVRYWDENLLQGHPPFEPFPQVVGITVHLTFARRAYELARWYRVRGSTVILGGLHVTSCPEEAAPHADALSMGNGVQTWPRILEDIEQGTLQKVYHGSFRIPYHEEPCARRDMVPRDSFLTTLSLNATRGCHNRCDFCYLSTEGVQMPYQMRRPQQIADEIRESGEPYAVFTDNNLGSKRDYLRELCRALKPLEIIWSAAVSIDVADDPTLVREMALAGCTGVFVGFESLTLENLEDARKKCSRPEDYARRVGLFHSCGIQVNASFVFGFDHDTPEIFPRTVEWVEKNRLACATFHILTPYPGTPLFRRLEQEGRLLHKNWDLYDTGHVVFRPKQMDPEQLLEGYRWAYRQLFSLKSILKRCPERLSEIPPYLVMTLLYKRLNRIWPWLIHHRLVHRAWRPLVLGAKRRNLRFRAALERGEDTSGTSMPVGASV